MQLIYTGLRLIIYSVYNVVQIGTLSVFTAEIQLKILFKVQPFSAYSPYFTQRDFYISISLIYNQLNRHARGNSLCQCADEICPSVTKTNLN